MKHTSYYMFLVALTITSNCWAMKIIGHRGACGYEPENTLSSFQLAIDMQVDAIELDVYVCATGELVVIHDDTVDRTTNGHGNVTDMTFNQLRNLIVEGKEQIPTLQEVIELVDRKVPINIELKGPNTAQPVAQLLMNYMEKGWTPSDFIISSFEHDQIKLCKQLCPAIQIGALFEETFATDLADIALSYHADFIGLDYESVSQQVIDNTHNAGLKFLMFTVNKRELADQLEAMGVDGIFSNFPDKMR